MAIGCTSPGDTSSVRANGEKRRRRAVKKEKVRSDIFSFYSLCTLTGGEVSASIVESRAWFDRKGNPIRSYPRIDPAPRILSSKPNCATLATTPIRNKSLTGSSHSGRLGSAGWPRPTKRIKMIGLAPVTFRLASSSSPPRSKLW